MIYYGTRREEVSRRAVAIFESRQDEGKCDSAAEVVSQRLPY